MTGYSRYILVIEVIFYTIYLLNKILFFKLNLYLPAKRIFGFFDFSFKKLASPFFFKKLSLNLKFCQNATVMILFMLEILCCLRNNGACVSIKMMEAGYWSLVFKMMIVQFRFRPFIFPRETE